MTEYSERRGVLTITRTEIHEGGARQHSSEVPAEQSVLGRFLSLTGIRRIVLYAN